MARIAKSLDVLRSQVNAQWPSRSKSSDGWIGDTAHAARKSDHNPNAEGVVQALDITHDPKHGLDAGKFADMLMVTRDRRIKYVISNRRIGASYTSGGRPAWTWGPYGGSNPHDKHCHVSVSDDAERYDDPRPWKMLTSVPIVESPPPDVLDATRVRLRMGRTILGYEQQPPYKIEVVSDGTREIGGVNERYHKEKFDELAILLRQGNSEAVADAIARYLVDYTAIAATWHSNGAVQFYLRDCVFNRGPTGAAKILQRAVGVPIDGAVGPQTKRAMEGMSVDALLDRLRTAREAYERTLPISSIDTRLRNETWNKWRGMVNRWNKARADADQFKGFTFDAATGALVAGGAVVVGGGVVVATKEDAGANWGTIIPVVLIVLGIAVIVTVLLRRRRK